MSRIVDHHQGTHIWFRRGDTMFEIVPSERMMSSQDQVKGVGWFVGLRDGIQIVTAEDKSIVLASLVTSHDI